MPGGRYRRSRAAVCQTCSAGGRALPLLTSFAALILLAASLFIPSLAVVIIAGALLNISIGVLSGCYLTRLTTNVPKMHRGLVFGIAYALGSLGTWFISMPMGGRFLWHAESIFAMLMAVIPCSRLSQLRQWRNACGLTGSDTKTIWLAAVVLILIHGKSIFFPSRGQPAVLNRVPVIYSAGLIMAGLVNDKDRRGSYLASHHSHWLGRRYRRRSWIMAICSPASFQCTAYSISDISGKYGLPPRYGQQVGETAEHRTVFSGRQLRLQARCSGW